MYIKPKQFTSYISMFEVFGNPKRSLEQYHTPVDVCQEFVYLINGEEGITGKKILDLGAGTGILSLGCLIFEPDSIVSVEIDPEAIEIFKENIKQVGDEKLENKITIINKDILKLTISEKENLKQNNFDFVIMNPPFGASKNEGIDLQFINLSNEVISKGCIYLITKESRVKGITSHCKAIGLSTKILSEFDYEIEYKEFDKKDLLDWKKVNSKSDKNNKYSNKYSYHKKEKQLIKCVILKLIK